MTHTLTDASTMVQRNLIRLRRYPTMLFSIIIMPIVMLLMMNYFFGGALQNALPAGGPLGGRYINYLMPGMLLFIPSMLTVSVAVAVNQDVTEGIVDRLRSLGTSPTAILIGHVASGFVQASTALILLLAAGFAMGFRPTAGPLEWIAALALLAFITYGLVWFSVACGVVAKSPEAASNMPLPFMLLPYLGSGLVPTASMPSGVRWFAEYQPFSPMADTLRGLLMGTLIGNSWIWALGWCAVFALGGHAWAVSAFRRSTSD